MKKNFVVEILLTVVVLCIPVLCVAPLCAASLPKGNNVSSVDEVDSIRIKSYLDCSFETACRVSRLAFLYSLEKKEGIRDTLLKETQDVALFMRLLKQLPKLEMVSAGSDEVTLELKCDKSGNIVCSPQNGLGDNRGIIVLHKKYHDVFLWITTNGIYYQKIHYDYTDEFRHLLEKWGVNL